MISWRAVIESLDLLRSAVEGVIGYDRAPFHVIRKLDPSPEFEAFIRQYGAATNKYPSTWAINAYDAVMAWAKAAETAGSFDTEPVVDTLERLQLPSLRGAGRYIRKADHQANVGESFEANRLTIYLQLGAHNHFGLAASKQRFSFNKNGSVQGIRLTPMREIGARTEFAPAEDNLLLAIIGTIGNRDDTRFVGRKFTPSHPDRRPVLEADVAGFGINPDA